MRDQGAKNIASGAARDSAFETDSDDNEKTGGETGGDVTHDPTILRLESHRPRGALY